EAGQPHEPLVFQAHTIKKTIVETATTIIGRGKIDRLFSSRNFFSCQIVTTTQHTTTAINTATSVYPSHVLGVAPYPFNFGVNQNSFTTISPRYLPARSKSASAPRRRIPSAAVAARP